jgi:hypothetical protein
MYSVATRCTMLRRCALCLHRAAMSRCNVVLFGNFTPLQHHHTMFQEFTVLQHRIAQYNMQLRRAALSRLGGYAVGSFGGTACVNGTAIKSATSCAAAAAALNIGPYSGSGSWPEYPPGCVHDSYVMLNTNTSGVNAHAYYKPICSGALAHTHRPTHTRARPRAPVSLL